MTEVPRSTCGYFISYCIYLFYVQGSMHAVAHVWRSQVSLQESVLSFYRGVPDAELGFSGLVAISPSPSVVTSLRNGHDSSLNRELK